MFCPCSSLAVVLVAVGIVGFAVAVALLHRHRLSLQRDNLPRPAAKCSHTTLLPATLNAFAAFLPASAGSFSSCEY